MKRFVILSLLAILALFPVRSASAQENPAKDEPKAASSRPEGPQLKVQVVFSEFDGEKKVKSLPYMLLTRVEGPQSSSKIRMGSRVPVVTGGTKGAPQFQYMDVGTNIDCHASPSSDGRYRLYLSLERSWVEGTVPASSAKATTAPNESPDIVFDQPIIRQFKSDSTMVLRDGQSMETNFATDPFSGKVIKLEVSISVVK